MGGCLYRERLQELSELPQLTNIETQYEEFNNITEIMNLKNTEILQITQLNQKYVILKKYSEKHINFKIIEIQGNVNMMYLEIHKQLSQSQNFFVGAITQNDKCYLVVRIVHGLAAQVSVQEIQSIDGEIQQIIRKRFDEKFLCIGSIYLDEMVILVFRQIFLKMKCPLIEQYNSVSNDTLCLIQYRGQTYELKKQI